MDGLQKTKRDASNAQLMQAVRSGEVQSILQRSSPNEALNSPFGNIRILRASFFQALSDRRIAAEVARTYESQLDELLRVGLKPEIGDEFLVKLAEESVPHLPTIQELAAHI